MRLVRRQVACFLRADEPLLEQPLRVVDLGEVATTGIREQAHHALAIAQLARRLAKPSLREQLLTMTDPQEIAELLDDEVVRS